MAKNMASMVGKMSSGAGLAAFGLVTASSCLYNVDAGHAGLLFDNLRGGIMEDVKLEGTHILLPVIQRPIIIDVRTKAREIPSITGTKDLQIVNIKVRVLWRPKKEKLAEIYKSLGLDFDDRVLPSIGNEVLKSVVAQYNAEELLSKRSEVSMNIQKELVKRAAHFNLLLDDVAITHLSFGPEYMKAVESKQVAQQDAERQVFLFEKAEQEKIATVIRAEGQAEAARITNEAMEGSGKGIIEVRRIDAAKAIAEKLARNRNVTYLPGGGGGGGGGGGNILLGIDGK
ncbi:hypothetical protein ScalyP_jg11802 [Parmales sp. scaly parma]|nr:hypothetical protein ScalyP_jg11802 [Parmales sp. scaly parma]